MKTIARLGSWHQLSLKSQLIIMMTLIIILVMIGITTVSALSDYQRSRQELEMRAGQILDSLEAGIIDALYLGDVDRIDTVSSNFLSNESVLGIRVYSTQGRNLVVTDDPSLEFSLTNNEEIYPLTQRVSTETIWHGPEGQLIYRRSFHIGSQVLGVGQVTLSTAAIYVQFYNNLMASLMIAAAAIIANVLAVMVVSRRLIAPISALVRNTKRIGEGELTEPIQRINSSSEIMQLADTIETMRSNLLELYTTLESRVAKRTAELKIARDEALQARSIAEEHSRLKSEFLSTMSHELRTPLNAIEGFTSIMLSGMGVELNDRAKDMVRRVNVNSKRLLQLINDILDISRIEAGRMEITYHPVQVRSLSQQWHNAVNAQAEDKGIALNFRIDETFPAEIYSDEDALTKIAVNLLSNAVKFTREGAVSLDMTWHTDHYLITVTDTGIGIPIHAQQYIFDEFRQVDGTSRREYGGTGLGLTLVSKLTQALNGQVKLESEVGIGSKFTITLPVEAIETAKG